MAGQNFVHLKDMIIRGGENIYPREIEEFYLTNPKVRDVQVVGVRDKALLMEGAGVALTFFPVLQCRAEPCCS